MALFIMSLHIDLSVLGSTIMQTFLYFAIAQTACVVVHLLLCKLFKIDGGTALITNVAGIYGPPFIAPVAEAYHPSGEDTAPGFSGGTR